MFVEKLRERGLADKHRLETMPYRQLVEEYTKIEEELSAEGYEVTRCPVENAYYLGHPLKHGFCERAREIPLMVGSVFGEFDLRLVLLAVRRAHFHVVPVALVTRVLDCKESFERSNVVPSNQLI